MTPPEPIPVRTLLGAKGFETSATCLRSLVEYSADPVRLIVHEDGTLTDEHRDQLRDIEPRVELISRPAADEAVDGLLSRHPRCAAARCSGPLFLKLFDVALLSPGELNYCDSDVFFLRRYAGLFRSPAGGRAVFMTDVTHAYAVRPWRVWPISPIRLLGRVNTGLIIGWRVGLDLDFVEWLLGRLAHDPAFTRRAYWAEQTCWAALAARSDCTLLDPQLMILASATMKEHHPGVVAIHFVSTYRDRLAGFLHRQRPRDELPVEVPVHPAGSVSAMGLLWTDLRRRIGAQNGHHGH
jgi:hypothetical protein